MKPRLDQLPVTIEDVIVQIDVVARCGRIVDGSMFGYWVFRRGMEADRRDADLMWSMAHVAAKHGYTTKERQQVLALYFGDPLGIPLVANEDVA